MEACSNFAALENTIREWPDPIRGREATWEGCPGRGRLSWVGGDKQELAMGAESTGHSKTARNQEALEAKGDLA